jgi:hypothetical protein
MIQKNIGQDESVNVRAALVLWLCASVSSCKRNTELAFDSAGA